MTRLTDSCWEETCDSCESTVEVTCPGPILSCFNCEDGVEFELGLCFHGIPVDEPCGACDDDERGDFEYHRERDR